MMVMKDQTDVVGTLRMVIHKNRKLCNLLKRVVVVGIVGACGHEERTTRVRIPTRKQMAQTIQRKPQSNNVTQKALLAVNDVY